MSISIIVYIICGLLLIILGYLGYTEYRLSKIFRGSDAKSLENVMAEIKQQMIEVEAKQKQIDAHFALIDKRLSHSIRSIETVRFNPFADAGSNQSFAISLLNDNGDGVILSSLYARDRMSIFAKPISRGTSEFELSVEEKEVLEKSKS